MPEFLSRIGSFARRTRRDPLVLTVGSTRKRDVYKSATAGITGITAFGALAISDSR